MNSRASEGQERRRRRFRRDDESGLTTLEWLLIVAAVAGLAALAVVLVTRVVEDTSEQISGNSARVTAAELAAADLTRQARTAGAGDNADTATEWNTLSDRFEDRCNQLEIIYGDIEGLNANWAQDDPATPMTDTAAAVTNAWDESLDGDDGGTSPTGDDAGCTVEVS